jgi:hydroxycarboxylate dehydrogenase B
MMRAKRLAEGMPVDATTWSELLSAAGALGINPADLNRHVGL